VTTLPRRAPTANARPLAGRPPGPDPARLAGLLVRSWLEVRAGRRPLGQLAPLVTPAVLRRLTAQLVTPTPIGAPVPQVRRVRATFPSPVACEASVTVHDGMGTGRTTAIAVRLERNLGRWRVVELMAPEAGLRPLASASFPEGYRVRDAFDEALEEDEAR
jgi:hypothetical protein